MQQTIIKQITHTVLGSALFLGVASANAVECSTGLSPVEFKGTIINNGQNAEEVGASTLGVATVKVGRRFNVLARMKCGVIGVNAATEDEPFAFTHTFSCNDHNVTYLGADFGFQRAHSQLTFNTHGDLSIEGSCAPISNGFYGSFVEYSSPSANNTGRGLFTDVTEGEVVIEGDVNCLGSIDMTFKGYLCMTAPRR